MYESEFDLSVHDVPTLYVVATPIGNLQDISLRALEVLKSVDSIAAEDTRHTSHLLSHFAIQKKLIAVHEHNEQKSAQFLLERIQAGESIALVSDAGTPGISDPLESLKGFTTTLVFYEAPHRILECVEDLASVLGGERRITIARELTKTFETFHRCALQEAKMWLEADQNQQRGEFVLLVEAAAAVEVAAISEDEERVLRLLLEDLPLKQAVKLATEITGLKKNILYEFALKIKDNEHE